jgi:hypothetical protein
MALIILQLYAAKVEPAALSENNQTAKNSNPPHHHCYRERQAFFLQLWQVGKLSLLWILFTDNNQNQSNPVA